MMTGAYVTKNTTEKMRHRRRQIRASVNIKE
jgi:hypothetical protein